MTSSDHESDAATKLAKPDQEALAPEAEDPPVVARMVVEIRSDGFRTVARGALEDASSGDRVAVVARGTTPMALAASLAKTIFSAPMLAKHAVFALIRNRLNKKEP